ncbi:MAG: substrate-binding domain-containing protein [Pedobacter sp.]|nr:substrate-binding domain-containing protein [Pedobacter sp.]MDQ8052230.1 substrate-binding domain-containing protein [Pedobacter sp.]
MKITEEKELTGVKEIARRAEVSIATVDRVLHNRQGVSIKTKNKILSIIAELDYQPNILARTLASKKILKFAVLIPEASNETAFWEAPLTGILKAEEEIKRYGIQIDKYFFDQNDTSSFVAKTEQLLHDHVDGILMAPMFTEESIAFTNDCKRLNIPYVFINSDLPDQQSLCYFGPDLYQSGYMGAHLLRYLVPNQAKNKILLVNISKEINQRHHLLQKEKGFKSYFEDHNRKNEIIKIDVRQTDYASVEREMDQIFAQHQDISAIFVSNSRVSSVARYIEQHNKTEILLIGFDFLPQNIEYLKNDVIDFLICQKPQEQGYKGIMALYNKMVHGQSSQQVNFMPIDIISRENYLFYHN